MILAIQSGLSNARSEGYNGSSNTSVGSRSDSEHQQTNAAEYGGPAPANHGERHPKPGSAPVKSEERRNFFGAIRALDWEAAATPSYDVLSSVC
jgi:hypothetical protein